jgi:hypothetical protein
MAFLLSQDGSAHFFVVIDAEVVAFPFPRTLVPDGDR